MTTLIPDQNTVQFNTGVTAGNTISIITVENTSVQAVTGLMFEEDFAHTDKWAVEVRQNCYCGFRYSTSKGQRTCDWSSGKGETNRFTYHSNRHSNRRPMARHWSGSNQLKFYDGTQWLRTSPDSSLPTFSTGNAGQFVKVNGTGTALEYAGLDLSSVIALSQKGAANGVAALDSNGRLPTAQLPANLSTSSMYHIEATASNQTYVMQRIYKQNIRIEAISVMTSSGTCNVKININGTDYGDIYAASSAPNEQLLGTPRGRHASVKRCGYRVYGKWRK